MLVIVIIVLFLGLILFVRVFMLLMRNQSRQILDWPVGIMQRVALALPGAGESGLALAKSGFESYLAAVKYWGPAQSVAMPSRAVDEVWHNAMLHSRFYAALCQERVGWFVHHEPGPVPTEEHAAEPCRARKIDPRELDELARAWVGASAHEGIDPMGTDIPTLFAADRLVGVKGFAYAADSSVSIIPVDLIQEAARRLGAPMAKKRWFRR